MEQCPCNSLESPCFESAAVSGSKIRFGNPPPPPPVHTVLYNIPVLGVFKQNIFC